MHTLLASSRRVTRSLLTNNKQRILVNFSISKNSMASGHTKSKSLSRVSYCTVLVPGPGTVQYSTRTGYSTVQYWTVLYPGTVLYCTYCILYSTRYCTVLYSTDAKPRGILRVSRLGIWAWMGLRTPLGSGMGPRRGALTRTRRRRRRRAQAQACSGNTALHIFTSY